MPGGSGGRSETSRDSPGPSVRVTPVHTCPMRSGGRATSYRADQSANVHANAKGPSTPRMHVLALHRPRAASRVHGAGRGVASYSFRAMGRVYAPVKAGTCPPDPRDGRWKGDFSGADAIGMCAVVI
eukprot:CAMPEP_0185179154 /NCGR_PEP_ID=MMETSP1139-20130426/31869_1 /TAXON_ID=298111 /ORGANISM="Pavlova sp., Strain CCMP459" /LENGTH=126 /DNA_ID=CAMNT_0027744989 /DNA_START=92 /DNA_END=472 /DNA_ORIENTATION=-